jgi:endoglucanase
MLITRRRLVKLAASAVVAKPRVVFSGPPRALWECWVQSYVRSGRIIDGHQKGISHSEGQGYGLLLAQAHGDRDVFEQIESWTTNHLSVRDDRLMAWKWQPGAGNNIPDWHNATDGDLFRAWALLRAGRDSGWTEHTDAALRIARDIARLCLAPDPRAADEPLLLPGAEARRDANRVLINPSYIMPRALRELGDAAGEPALVQAADHGETVLAELAATGFLPNWVDVTPTGFAMPTEHDFRWGYDALRIPLYLAWSGRTDHPAVRSAASLMSDGALPEHVVVEATPQGEVLQASDRAGFTAIRRLIDCANIDVSSAVIGADYYSDTLLMLIDLAFREGECNTPAQ